MWDSFYGVMKPSTNVTIFQYNVLALYQLSYLSIFFVWGCQSKMFWINIDYV